MSSSISAQKYHIFMRTKIEHIQKKLNMFRKKLNMFRKKLFVFKPVQIKKASKKKKNTHSNRTKIHIQTKPKPMHSNQKTH